MLAVGSPHFDWLDNLRDHISVNEIIQVLLQSRLQRVGTHPIGWERYTEPQMGIVEAIKVLHNI